MTQISKLQLLGSESSELNWVDEFQVGSIIEGKVNEKKEFGVVISFEKYKDIFGFISQYQCKSAFTSYRSLVSFSSNLLTFSFSSVILI